MNNVVLIGRLTRDADVRYTSDGLAIARFTLAINRPTKEKQTDFPTVKALGKTAEIVEKYTAKGMQIAVEGSIQTGSYEKDGERVYYTEVLASRVELISGKAKPEVPDGFEATDEELPF